MIKKNLYIKKIQGLQINNSNFYEIIFIDENKYKI